MRIFQARPGQHKTRAQAEAAQQQAIDRLRGPSLHPRAVSAAPPHPRACTPGDKVPPQRAFDAVRAGPPSSFQQLRELSERNKREDADIRAALRRARAARRRAWRPPVLHACSTSTPRRRERRARMVAASGRNGDGARDDGGGSDGDGGGSGSDPPPALACDIAGRAL